MLTIKANGDVWKVRLGEDRPRPGIRLVLFFSQPTGQRPYRVVEVDESRVSSQEALERLANKELLDLFAKSTSMDVPVYRSDEVTDVRRNRS